MREKRFGLEKRQFGMWMPPLICCLSILTQSDHSALNAIPSSFHLDKVFHFLTCGALGILFYLAYGSIEAMDKFARRLLLSVLSAVCFGILDEVHQTFSRLRQPDALDALANLAGAVGGTVSMGCADDLRQIDKGA